MIKIIKRKHKNRTERARVMWMEWLDRYNKGEDPVEFLKEYTSPRTGKPYTRSSMYRAFARLESL